MIRVQTFIRVVFGITISLFIQESTAQSIATGMRHSIVVCDDNTVRVWGYNQFGQLGNNDTADLNLPTPLKNMSQVASVAGGTAHSLFVLETGAVLGTGSNLYGAIGDGSYSNRWIPTPVFNMRDVKSVSAGSSFSLFLKKDGTVWSCGGNSTGQLGDGTTQKRNFARKIEGLDSVVQVEAGWTFSLFLKENGTVWACGDNGFGQLGIGNNLTILKPIQVPGLEGITHVSAGQWHSIFVKNDGSVWSCGRNQEGQLGLGHKLDQNVPVKIEGLSSIVQVSTGQAHSAFVSVDGKVWTCGLNSGGFHNGQLGDGTDVDKLTPVLIKGNWENAKIVHVSCGIEFTLFLDENGQIWTCGRNTFGQLGIGSFMPDNFLVPVKSILSCRPKIVSTMEEGSLQNSIDIYPNPFEDVLHISSRYLLEDAALMIHDLNGRILWKKTNLTGLKFSMDIPNMEAGIYFISILDSKGIDKSSISRLVNINR